MDSSDDPRPQPGKELAHRETCLPDTSCDWKRRNRPLALTESQDRPLPCASPLPCLADSQLQLFFWGTLGTVTSSLRSQTLNARSANRAQRRKLGDHSSSTAFCVWPLPSVHSLQAWGSHPVTQPLSHRLIRKLKSHGSHNSKQAKPHLSPSPAPRATLHHDLPNQD